MEQRPNRPQGRAPQRGNNAMGMLVSAVVLGVSIIIAGASINGSVKKLTEAVTAQTFSSTLSSPSNITVKNTAPKNYYTEKEAADYLCISVDEIKAAITKGEIDEYIKTSSGYVIAQEKLDNFFEQKAYDTMNSNNAENSSGE